MRTKTPRFDYSDKTTAVERFVTRDDTEYTRMADGSVRRVSPRPYRGKSERRRVIRQRRLDKAAKVTTEQRKAA